VLNTRFIIFSVDGFNKEQSGIARYGNDDWIKPNARVTKEVVDGQPCLFLKAIRCINEHEEILYDYNDSSAPWRWEEVIKKVKVVLKVYVTK